MILSRIAYLLKTDKVTRRADKREYNILFEQYVNTFRDEQDAYNHMVVVRVYDKNKTQMSDRACRVEFTDAKTGQIRAVHQCSSFNCCGYVYCPRHDYMQKWTDARMARVKYAWVLQHFWADKIKSRSNKGK